MEKIILTVPEGTEYITNWKNYEIPKGHCIVDKGITGCGYTEMCLRNNLNVILCSPRKMLLENKREQHIKLGNRNILYLDNKFIEDKEEDTRTILMERARAHIAKCRDLNKPVKFMITYDSSKYLIDLLISEGLLNDFYVVADEFQSIFLDSYFKAEIENNFITTLQRCPNVIYLSATPMLDRYLEQVDEFKDLKLYKLDWSKSGYVETIKLQHKQVRTLSTEAEKVIQQYLDGDYPIMIDNSGIIHQSKEAVLFFNSVAEIIKIIKKKNLTANQCNILCADDNTNEQKIKKLGKDFVIGTIPLKGEPNKMFTFCTKTVYIGADFYSDCASTYIFADPNLNCLALDISLDLPQIAGRQRNRNNPFKNYVTIFYKTLRDENINSREEFDKVKNERIERTNISLNLYNKGNDKEKEEFIKDRLVIINSLHYSDKYLSINQEGKPVYNKFIELADERAWEVSQKDYQDSINVTKAFDSIKNIEEYEYKDSDDKIISDFLDNQFYATGIFTKKLKLYCEFVDKYKDNEYIMKILLVKVPDPKFRSYYNLLGTNGCKTYLFRDDLIKKEISNRLNGDKIAEEVLKVFSLKNKYSKKFIKTKLSEIYVNLKITSTAKAVDLEKWFELRPLKFVDPITKAIENGFEILALKGKA